MTSERRSSQILGSLGILLEALFLAIGYGISTDVRHIRVFVVLFLAAFLIQVAAIVLVARLPSRTGTPA